MRKHIWLYLSDPERDRLVAFVQSLREATVLGMAPGNERGLGGRAIAVNPHRKIAVCGEADVATVRVRTDRGMADRYDPNVTPLIEWQVPYQRDRLVIGGYFLLEAHPDMMPGGPLRSAFLDAQKLLRQISRFMEANFVKVDASLFNGPEAMALIDQGFEAVPFDPEKTTLTIAGK